MANEKQYAYFIEGNKLCIVEKDLDFSNNVENKEFGPGVSRRMWKSPVTSVADGIELQYAYSPKYIINEIEDVDTQIDSYYSANGLLVLDDAGDNDYAAGPESLTTGSYIVLKQAGRWNGLHKVASLVAGKIILDTKYVNGLEDPGTAFEKTPQLYYNVSALEDESSHIDLPSYLSKGLVNYVKAKLAEDAGNIEVKEYFMREFKKILEKHENSKVSGVRIIGSGSHAIR
mgnify:CR=1 FL=1|tara:strand:+ start:2232 stop:2921 length:690 start_codon:yes stop_codon:yes gene_type:complete